MRISTVSTLELLPMHGLLFFFLLFAYSYFPLLGLLSQTALWVCNCWIHSSESRGTQRWSTAQEHPLH